MLENLVDFVGQEVDYLFMQKKWFTLQQQQYQMDMAKSLETVQKQIEVTYCVILESKKQNDMILNLIMQKELNSSLTNTVINMTLSMQKFLSSLKLNQP